MPHLPIRAAALLLVLSTLPALADDAPYAGQQDRAVSSLSAGDIDALVAGAGWGLARPAELNGWPGPLHVLELATEMGLDDRQIREVTAIFENMRAQARALGPDLIAAERALDDAFRAGEVDPDRLDLLLAEAGRKRAALRAVHLKAHLHTTPILSRHQRHVYQSLRGYSAGGHGKHKH